MRHRHIHRLLKGAVTLLIRDLTATDLTMSNSADHGHRFPPAVIQLTVWMYGRFTLSLSDVEELLAQRRLDVSYETIHMGDRCIN